MSIEQPVALGVPLAGVQLIEASAGTGKTWTLSGIFLRLVMETDVAIGGILAVTFTRAATAELRERIRRRLAAMLDLLEGRGTDDGLCALLATRLTDTGRARLKLRAALYGFDDAALYTIHGFCQRVLRDRAFASAMPFETEVLADTGELLGAVVAETKKAKKGTDLFSSCNRRYLRYGQRSGGTSDAQEGKDRYTRCCPSRGSARP